MIYKRADFLPESSVVSFLAEANGATGPGALQFSAMKYSVTQRHLFFSLREKKIKMNVVPLALSLLCSLSCSLTEPLVRGIFNTTPSTLIEKATQLYPTTRMATTRGNSVEPV